MSPHEVRIEVAHFATEVVAELARARAKFPSANLSLVALMEEVGELAQAKLKVRAGTWPASRVREEAIQVAVMAMRVALEEDASFSVGYVEPDPDCAGEPALCERCHGGPCDDFMGNRSNVPIGEAQP